MSDIFPTTPAPDYPLKLTPRWSTLVSKFDSGAEQRRVKRLYPVYDVELKYKTLTKTEAETLYVFYMARRGMAEAFVIYDLFSQGHICQYVGVGDGATTIFDLPGKSTSSHEIYIDGQVQSSGFEILYGDGDGDSDRVEFETAPAQGQVLTCDFTGFLRIRVRFAKDELTRETFDYLLYTYGIDLEGLGAEL